MKTNLILFACAVFVAGCSGNVRKNTLAEDLRRDPYEFLAQRLSASDGTTPNRKVAVLPFAYTDGKESDDGVVISERLLTRLIEEGKLEMVERNLLEKVMSELKLQYSGAMDDNSIKSLGKILGVDAVVTGTLTRQAGGRIDINARLIKVDTAVIVAASAVSVPCDWEAFVPVPVPATVPETPPTTTHALAQSVVMDFPKAWKYRENMRVAEKSGSSLVDYQVQVKFDSAAPIRHGRMKADCSDLRFTNSNETSKLSYWIEAGCNSSQTRVWVRLPFLARNSVKNIYLLYGNPSSSAESSGDGTFAFFDDFNDNSMDSAKWSFVRGQCPAGESNGRLELAACSYGTTMTKAWFIPSKKLEGPSVVDVDLYRQGEAGSNSQWQSLVFRWDGQILPEPNNIPLAGLMLMAYTDGLLDMVQRDPAKEYGGYGFQLGSAAGAVRAGKWEALSVADDGKKIKISVNGAPKLYLSTDFSAGTRWGLFAREYPGGSEVYFDNIRVRAYASVEPEVYAYAPSFGARNAARYKGTK